MISKSHTFSPSLEFHKPLAFIGTSSYSNQYTLYNDNLPVKFYGQYRQSMIPQKFLGKSHYDTEFNSIREKINERKTYGSVMPTASELRQLIQKMNDEKFISNKYCLIFQGLSQDRWISSTTWRVPTAISTQRRSTLEFLIPRSIVVQFRRFYLICFLY